MVKELSNSIGSLKFKYYFTLSLRTGSPSLSLGYAEPEVDGSSIMSFVVNEPSSVVCGEEKRKNETKKRKRNQPSLGQCYRNINNTIHSSSHGAFSINFWSILAQSYWTHFHRRRLEKKLSPPHTVLFAHRLLLFTCTFSCPVDYLMP